VIGTNVSGAADGFGEHGKPASGDEGAVPPNATLQITLELVSWKTVSYVSDDKKVVKKILKEGEGYDHPNEGAIVKCKQKALFYVQDTHCLFVCFLTLRYFVVSEIDWKAGRRDFVFEEGL